MQQRFVVLALLAAFSGALHAEEESINSKISTCNSAVREGDIPKALAYADQILRLDANNRDALLCKGRAHGSVDQNDQAMTALQAAEKLSKTPLEHMVGQTLIGNVYRNIGKYTEALTAYRGSLALAQADKNDRFTRINYNQIGDTLAATNQYQGALDSYLAGNKLSANGNESAESYARIAAAYSALKQHDKAIEYQIKAVNTEATSGDLDHQANAGLELGRIYTVAGEYAKAEKAINKILEMSQQQGGQYWEAKSDYYLGVTRAANGQPKDAKQLMEAAQAICLEIHADALNEEITVALNQIK